MAEFDINRMYKGEELNKKINKLSIRFLNPDHKYVQDMNNGIVLEGKANLQYYKPESSTYRPLLVFYNSFLKCNIYYYMTTAIAEDNIQNLQKVNTLANVKVPSSVFKYTDSAVTGKVAENKFSAVNLSKFLPLPNAVSHSQQQHSKIYRDKDWKFGTHIKNVNEIVEFVDKYLEGDMFVTEPILSGKSQAWHKSKRDGHIEMYNPSIAYMQLFINFAKSYKDRYFKNDNEYYQELNRVLNSSVKNYINYAEHTKKINDIYENNKNKANALAEAKYLNNITYKDLNERDRENKIRKMLSDYFTNKEKKEKDEIIEIVKQENKINSDMQILMNKIVDVVRKSELKDLNMSDIPFDYDYIKKLESGLNKEDKLKLVEENNQYFADFIQKANEYRKSLIKKTPSEEKEDLKAKIENERVLNTTKMLIKEILPVYAEAINIYGKGHVGASAKEEELRSKFKNLRSYALNLKEIKIGKKVYENTIREIASYSGLLKELKVLAKLGESSEDKINNAIEKDKKTASIISGFKKLVYDINNFYESNQELSKSKRTERIKEIVTQFVSDNKNVDVDYLSKNKALFDSFVNIHQSQMRAEEITSSLSRKFDFIDYLTRKNKKLNDYETICNRLIKLDPTGKLCEKLELKSLKDFENSLEKYSDYNKFVNNENKQKMLEEDIEKIFNFIDLSSAKLTDYIGFVDNLDKNIDVYTDKCKNLYNQVNLSTTKTKTLLLKDQKKAIKDLKSISGDFYEEYPLIDNVQLTQDDSEFIKSILDRCIKNPENLKEHIQDGFRASTSIDDFVKRYELLVSNMDITERDFFKDLPRSINSFYDSIASNVFCLKLSLLDYCMVRNSVIEYMGDNTREDIDLNNTPPELVEMVVSEMSKELAKQNKTLIEKTMSNINLDLKKLTNLTVKYPESSLFSNTSVNFYNELEKLYKSFDYNEKIENLTKETRIIASENLTIEQIYEKLPFVPKIMEQCQDKFYADYNNNALKVLETCLYDIAEYIGFNLQTDMGEEIVANIIGEHTNFSSKRCKEEAIKMIKSFKNKKRDLKGASIKQSQNAKLVKFLHEGGIIDLGIGSDIFKGQTNIKDLIKNLNKNKNVAQVVVEEKKDSAENIKKNQEDNKKLKDKQGNNKNTKTQQENDKKNPEGGDDD